MSLQLLTQAHQGSQQKRARSSTIAASSIRPSVHPILQLQRTLGNHVVQRLIQAKQIDPLVSWGHLQPKLVVGAAGDHYEQEADHIANRVMTMPAPVAPHHVQRATAPEEEKEKRLQTKPLAASITPLAQRQMTPEEEEKKPVQAKPLAASITPIVQRQMAPEEKKEEKPVQTKPLAASITPLLQREMIPEEDKEKRPVQAKFLSDAGAPDLQREMGTEEEKEKKEQPIQAKLSVQRAATTEGFEAGHDFEARLARSKGGGNPLPDHVRAYMEPRFGMDFSGVRVHTDHESAHLNQEVGAQAFTHGQDIYFGAGKVPGVSDVTAHELTHVVQQTGVAQGKAFRHQGEEMHRACTTCAKTTEPSHACPACQERQVVQRLPRRQECDRLRDSCYWFCTKRHLWRFPPDVSGWLDCRKNFCDSCHRQCLKDGNFPCVF